MSLTVKVITPDKIVLDQPFKEVILPSKTGQLGILPGHAPLLTALDIGVMRVRDDKEWTSIAVMGGFAEVEKNEVKILVNSAEVGNTIDKDSAKIAYTKAQNELDEANKSENRQRKIQAEQAYKKARATFQATGGLV